MVVCVPISLRTSILFVEAPEMEMPALCPSLDTVTDIEMAARMRVAVIFWLESISFFVL